MYGQRVIAQMLAFCKDMREVCEKNVLHLNYSNPNAMVTWACNEYGGVNTVGLCHGEMHGEQQIAEALGFKDRRELDFICVGLNHQTWYLSVKHNGVELKDKILDAYLANEKLAREEKVRIDMLKRFGHYSTESNGHLSEYLAWYRKRPDEIKDWIDLGSWINGETGGYLRVCREGRDWFETDYPNWLKAPAKSYDGSERGQEHGSWIVEALECRRPYRGHFNVVNRGAIENLPADCVVEVPCYADGNGISVPRIGNLPDGCAAVCAQSVWVQRLAVKAAVAGDELAGQLFATAGRALGIALNDLVAVTGLDLVVIHGGVARGWFLLEGPCRAELAARLRMADPARIQIEVSRLGPDAPLLGAAALAAEVAAGEN